MHILNLAQSLIALDVAQLGGFRRPVPVCLCGGEGVAEGNTLDDELKTIILCQS